MNPHGAYIVDPGKSRVWETDPDLPTVRYKDGTVAPEMGAVFEDMRSTLEPVKRRTPKQRYESFMQGIVSQAVTGYQATGRVSWPRSAEKLLVEIARLNNDPTLLSEYGGVEQIVRQGKALARHITETGEMRQKAQDYKKVTRNWAGH